MNFSPFCLCEMGFIYTRYIVQIKKKGNEHYESTSFRAEETDC